LELFGIPKHGAKVGIPGAAIQRQSYPSAESRWLKYKHKKAALKTQDG
jgi:hypothetical protein